MPTNYKHSDSMKHMKNILLVLAFVLALAVQAQTNQVPVTQEQTGAAAKSQSWSVEATIGGGGISTRNSDGQFGLDFSLSTNPFEGLTHVWVGVAQTLAWEPSFAGSTDVFTDWSTHVYKDLWLNVGWSVGASYDTYDTEIWRTGPEATLQYYVGDSAFIYAGVNYDAFVSEGEDAFRYSFGVGLAF